MVVGNAGSPDAVEPSLEDGGKAEPPGGKDQHESVGAEQTLDPVFKQRRIERGTVIASSLRERDRRRKPIPVEIFDLHLMAGGDERVDSRLRQRVAQAIGVRVSDDDKTFHVGSSFAHLSAPGSQPPGTSAPGPLRTPEGISSRPR